MQISKKVKNIIYSILSVLITSFLCKYFNDFGMREWFDNVNKPSINPPSIVFPIVWNILYILLATSFYFILKNNDNKLSKNRRLAISYYILNLIFQVLWCLVFFTLNSMIIGIFVLIVLNIINVLTINEFRKIKNITIFMLMPYLMWTFFALILNISFLLVNI